MDAIVTFINPSLFAILALILCSNSYRNDNSYKASTPANILRGCLQKETAEAILSNVVSRPLYEVPGRFQEDWSPLADKLPSHRDFLQKYASSPKLFGKCCCPVKDCEFSGNYQQDLLDHVKDVHSSKTLNPIAVCPGCKTETSLSNYKANHLKRCKTNIEANPMIFEKQAGFQNDHFAEPPPGVYVVRCKTVGCTYWTIPYYQFNASSNVAHKCNDEEMNSKPKAVKKASSSNKAKQKKTAPKKSQNSGSTTTTDNDTAAVDENISPIAPKAVKKASSSNKAKQKKIAPKKSQNSGSTTTTDTAAVDENISPIAPKAVKKVSSSNKAKQKKKIAPKKSKNSGSTTTTDTAAVDENISPIAPSTRKRAQCSFNKDLSDPRSIPRQCASLVNNHAASFDGSSNPPGSPPDDQIRSVLAEFDHVLIADCGTDAAVPNSHPASFDGSSNPPISPPDADDQIHSFLADCNFSQIADGGTDADVSNNPDTARILPRNNHGGRVSLPPANRKFGFRRRRHRK
eukprot:scaffold45582_cov63-Attheya_sp.AAC.2